VTTPTKARARPAALALGQYPTPVQRLDALSAPGCELWAKRDDLTNREYGGNKVRKLEWVLGEARARGTARIVTVGGIGSHHVLATGHFAKRIGIAVEAVLVPQPSSEHSIQVLRASRAQGVRAFPVRSWAAAVAVLIARIAKGAHFVPLGGSSVLGSMGYVDAARELATQVRAGALPEPDVCVVALGSGGTAAGLAAGFEAEHLRTRVVGVCVSRPPWASRVASLWLARACAKRAGVARPLATMRARLSADARFVGAGYGHPTDDGDAATDLARTAGLVLDPTYTAKAFACALWHVHSRAAPNILYWHTLSSAPMEPLLDSHAET
jgi:1-aminocyclopropane-1-carboxylate deaminase/D-cysteine desulfhydrase-like pyridoxal-dependent ACC family enzyme